MYLLTSCQYALPVLIPYTVCTNNRFLSPLLLMLSLSFMICCVLIVHLNDHTHSLLILHLCLWLHFVHFDGCVCGVAPLVASAFPFIHVCHTLHPVLHLASLHYMFHLCIFACLCLCIFAFLCVIIKLMSLHTSLLHCSHFVSLCGLCPLPALIDIGISRCYQTSTAFPLHHHTQLGGFWCAGFRVLLFFLALESV